MGDTGGRKPREGYVCRACGSDAHYIDDCPVANQRPAGGDRHGNQRGKRGPPKEIGRECCVYFMGRLYKMLTATIVQRMNAGFVSRTPTSRKFPSLFDLLHPDYRRPLRKHLIVAIGGECYVTLPKGQIILPDTSAVPGGGHVLIIPISHHPTFSTIPPDLAPPILEETEK